METNQGASFSPLIEISKGDPVIRFTVERKFSPEMIIAMGMGYGMIYTIILPFLFGSIGQVLADWPELLRTLAVAPLVLGYYVWQPTTIQELYDLAVHRALNPSAQEFEKISRLTKPFGYRFWFAIAIAFGIFNAVIYYFSLVNSPPGWQNSSTLIVFLSALTTFFSFYAVLHIIVRQIITIRGINKFFHILKIDISPLHPDRAGGLRPLGQYVVTIGLGIGIIGLALGISLLRSRMGLEHLQNVFYINLAVYMFAAPVFFFIPLIEAHRLMQKAKENTLIDIAGQYESLYVATLQKMKDGKPMSKDVAQLDALHKMYLIADTSPVWPFNIGTLTKFSAAVILPVVTPLVINYLTDFIIRLLAVLLPRPG